MAFGERLLLCVGAAQATLGRWRSGRLRACETFASDDEGLARFSAALASARGLPVHALVDAVEEDYRTEMLPHASGRERANMVQRRLRQLYRNSPYHAAVMQGRDGAGGRRDDRYLFAALTNADLFLPWADAIEKARLPFAGLYLLPLVMPSLAERLGIDRAPTLVITATASGLRQTFIEDGQLRVSRLIPLARTDEHDPIGALVDEVGNTRLYLEALKLRGRDDPLSITLVDTDDSMSSAADAIEQQDNNMTCVRIGVASLTAKLPVPAGMLLETPDALALTLLGLRTPTVNLAPAGTLRRFEVLSTQRAMYAAAGVIGLVGMSFAFANIWQQRQLNALAEQQRLETTRWQERYVEVTRQFPQAPAPLETLQRTVEAARHVTMKTRTPERGYAVVGDALEATGEIGLRRLTWRHGDALAPAGTAAAGTAAGAPIESLVIEAEISGFTGDLRAAVASIEAFAQRLNSDPRVQSATIARLPLNLSPGTSLSGNTQERTEEGGGSGFRILVVLKKAAT